MLPIESEVAFSLLSCLSVQSKRQHLKGRVRGHLSLRLETIKAQDPNLGVTGVPPAELWSTQLFRTIDSGRRQLEGHVDHQRLRPMLTI